MSSLNDSKKPNHHAWKDSVFQPELREDFKYWVETDRKTAEMGTV
jgi:hypothetical protein